MDINSLTNKLLEDSYSFHLTLFGIAISIITLLYSLAIEKKEELKILANADKLGRKDPIIQAKISASAKYIDMVKKTISSCNLVLILSLTNTLLSWICLRIYKCNLFICTIICIFILILMIIIPLLNRLVKQYKKDITI